MQGRVHTHTDACKDAIYISLRHTPAYPRTYYRNFNFTAESVTFDGGLTSAALSRYSLRHLRHAGNVSNRGMRNKLRVLEVVKKCAAMIAPFGREI